MLRRSLRLALARLSQFHGHVWTCLFYCACVASLSLLSSPTSSPSFRRHPQRNYLLSHCCIPWQRGNFGWRPDRARPGPSSARSSSLGALRVYVSARRGLKKREQTKTIHSRRFSCQGIYIYVDANQPLVESSQTRQARVLAASHSNEPDYRSVLHASVFFRKFS